MCFCPSISVTGLHFTHRLLLILPNILLQAGADMNVTVNHTFNFTVHLSLSVISFVSKYSLSPVRCSGIHFCWPNFRQMLLGFFFFFRIHNIDPLFCLHTVAATPLRSWWHKHTPRLCGSAVTDGPMDECDDLKRENVQLVTLNRRRGSLSKYGGVVDRIYTASKHGGCYQKADIISLYYRQSDPTMCIYGCLVLCLPSCW